MVINNRSLSILKILNSFQILLVSNLASLKSWFHKLNPREQKHDTFYKLYSNAYKNDELDSPNLIMLNFKSSFSKILNGTSYLNIQSELSRPKETLPTVHEESNPNSSLNMPDPYFEQSRPGHKKTEKMTSFFADKNNQFNFMSKSNFNLNLKGMVNMSSVQYNPFDFFQHGDEYLNYQMVRGLAEEYIYQIFR